jgi:hypothetical protein
MRRRPPSVLLVPLLLASSLAGCSADREDGDPSEAPRAAVSSAGTASPGTDGPERPTADPERDLLAWREVPGPTDDTVTVSGSWSLRVPASADEANLAGPQPTTVGAPTGHRVTDALLDEEYAVVVTGDERESQPSTATVIDLGSGERFTVDGESEVPTTTGGTWALGEGTLAHATIGPGRRYCLATVDLATRTSRLGWCAPARHGFNGAALTSAGTSMLTFDAGRPSCRTPVAVAGAEVTPIAGVEECLGWDAVLLQDGAVWSVTPRANRVEQAEFSARVGDDVVGLGPGTSGTLAWCGDAAYFVRDPQRRGDPARLMRWSPADGLTVALESDGGPAFLSEPRCGGETVTVTVFAESGDRQLTAPAS